MPPAEENKRLHETRARPLECEPGTAEGAMKLLVTGAAGFIGMHVAARLLQAGHQVTGIDNLSDYYDVELKQARLNVLQQHNFHFFKMDLADRENVNELFQSGKFE